MFNRFAPNVHLYISTLTHLLYYNTGKIADDVTLLIINLLSDGIGDDELNKELRTSTLDIYQKIVEDKLSKSLTTQDNAIVRLCIYFFGEYGDMFYDKEKALREERIKLENQAIERAKPDNSIDLINPGINENDTPRTDISITEVPFEGIEPAPLQFETLLQQQQQSEIDNNKEEEAHHHHHHHHHSKSTKSISKMVNTTPTPTSTTGTINNDDNTSIDSKQHKHKHRRHHHHRRRYHNIYTYFEILSKLYKPYYKSDNTKLLIITALTKLYIKTNIKINENIIMNLERDSLSTNVDISHRCDILLNLIHQNALAEAVKNVENVEPSEKLNDKIDIKSEIEIDEELSFLNKYVETSIKNGKKKYQNDRKDDESSPIKKREKKYNLVLHAYQAPTTIPGNLEYVTGVDSSGKRRYTKTVNPVDPTYEKMISSTSKESSNNSSNVVKPKSFSISITNSKSNTNEKDKDIKTKEVNLSRPRRNTAFSSSRNVFSLPTTPSSQNEDDSPLATDDAGKNSFQGHRRHNSGLLSKAINNPSSTPPPAPKRTTDSKNTTPKKLLPPAIPRKSK